MGGSESAAMEMTLKSAIDVANRLLADFRTTADVASQLRESLSGSVPVGVEKSANAPTPAGAVFALHAALDEIGQLQRRIEQEHSQIARAAGYSLNNNAALGQNIGSGAYINRR